MKLKIAALGAACAALMASPAFADSIDFAQFGPQGTNVADGAMGMTHDGVGFTISDNGAGFTEYLEDYSHTANGGSNTWAGEFANGETILFNNFDTGLTTVTFDHGINAIQDVEAQANSPGAYMATLTAYDGATELGAVSYSAYNDASGNAAVEGTIPHFDFFGANDDITSFTISTTNQNQGFALGGTGGAGNPPPVSGTPEPGAWALMMAGVAMLGASLRMSRRRQTGALSA